MNGPNSVSGITHLSVVLHAIQVTHSAAAASGSSVLGDTDQNGDAHAADRPSSVIYMLLLLNSTPACAAFALAPEHAPERLFYFKSTRASGFHIHHEQQVCEYAGYHGSRKVSQGLGRESMLAIQ
jgi:hypothetical protein